MGALLLLPLAAAADPTTDAMARWLETLEPGQRDEALAWAFDDEERFDLRLAPFGMEGLAGDDLGDARWRALMEVFGTAFSAQGLAKAETIMSLEREVRLRDASGWLTWPLQFIRRERRYFLAVFGEPVNDAPWGLRFDGHHLSLNWTFVPGAQPSVTPLFFGSEPREVAPEMERAGLRALPDEEDRARDLYLALDETRRARATLAFEPADGPLGVNRPLFVGEGGRWEPGAVEGVPASELTPEQRAKLDALLAVYLANFIGEVEAARRAHVERDPGAVHFAWAGSTEPGEPSYYRLQGPSFLIEFDNTVEAADHVHVVWREADGDYGRDLLAEHHAHAHGRASASARADQ